MALVLASGEQVKSANVGVGLRHTGMSLAFRIKITTEQASQRGLVGIEGGLLFSHGGSANQYLASVQLTGGAPVTFVAGTISDNDWHSVIITATDGAQNVYIDGTLTGSSTSGTGLVSITSTYKMIVGSGIAMTAAFKCEDVAFWTRVLSESERTMFDNGRCAGEIALDLRDWWRLETPTTGDVQVGDAGLQDETTTGLHLDDSFAGTPSWDSDTSVTACTLNLSPPTVRTHSTDTGSVQSDTNDTGSAQSKTTDTGSGPSVSTDSGSTSSGNTRSGTDQTGTVQV